MSKQVALRTFLRGFRSAFELGLDAQIVRAEMYRLLATGEPVQLDHLASVLGVSAVEAKERLRRATPSAAEFDEQGRVIAFGGLSQNPTTHRLRVGSGRTLYAWCAFDTLFIPRILGKRAEVASACASTGQPILFDVGPKGLGLMEPEGTHISLVVPDAEQRDRGVRASFCCHVHFFASEEVACAWLASHGGALISPLTEAFDLAISLFEPRLPHRGEGED